MNTKKKDLKKKDKILSKDASLAIVDAVVDNIPGASLAWNLSKALFGAGLKLRQEKALEWVEMVRDNPSVFTTEILNSEYFQDGFAVALEKYLVERNENKRRIFRDIFLGFTKTQSKQEFPLEKYIHTLSQLNELDIEVLKDTKNDQHDRNYQVYGNNDHRKENIYNLINEGLLFNATGTRYGYDASNSPFVSISNFGLAFKNYLVNT